MDKFLSINEARNLLGITDRAIRKNCNSGKYEVRQVKGNGGMRYEIALNSLPKEAQDRYQKTHLTQVAEQVSALLETPKTDLVIPQVDLFELSDRQREIARNRETILRFVADSGLKIRAALTYLNTGWALGSLPSALQYALENSFDKRHPQQLKERTYWSWVAEKQQRGDSVPQKRNRDFSVKPWHYMALELYRRPQKPTVQFVVEKLAEAFDPAPTYRQVDYFFSMKFSQSELLKGRNAGMALRALQYHKKRTAAGMLPWDELHADGWASHFTAPHPVTGEYVTYELWDVHDVATRYIPPFAIGLTENYEVIAKAVENAIRDNGIMAILQTDSTKIVKNNERFVGHPLLSIADRVGITIVHPKIVGNAQANGIAENFHSWLDKRAREIATYQAKNMDSLSFKRTEKLTAKLVKAKNSGDVKRVDELRKEIQKTSSGVLFESFQQAVDWFEAARIAWNNKPHSALKKVRDNTTGKSRHQTPQEALDEFKANGWQPMALPDAHIMDLFLIHRKCKVRRGVVTPYSSKVRFHHKDLAHWEGKEVIAAYDIMDYSQVWVKDMQGHLICIAPFDEPVVYRARTAYEAAQEKRAVAQIKNLKKKIVTIENRAGLVIDGVSKVIELPRQAVDFDDEFVIPERLKRLEFDEEDILPEPLKRLEFDDEESTDNGVDFTVMSREEQLMFLWGDSPDDDTDEVDCETK